MSASTLASLRPTTTLGAAARRSTARAAALLALAVSATPAAFAQLPFSHPAVAAASPAVHAAGYDYASKFYRHPAGLDLAATYTPHAGTDHPAVLAKRAEPGYDYASKFYRHPAGMALAATYHVHAGHEHPAVLVKRAETQDVALAAVATHPALVARDTTRPAASRVAAR